MELHPVETPERPGPKPNTFFNERGLRAGWRLLIFIALITIIQLVLGAVLKLIQGRQAAPSAALSLSPFSILLSRTIGFLILAAATWIMARIERRDMGVYGLPIKGSGMLSRFLAGYIFWGFLPLSVLLLAMRALHVFYFGNLALHGGQIFSWGLIWAAAFLFVALFEEYGFRGYLLYTLSDGLGFWPAAVILAAIFAYLHSLNPDETRIGVILTGVFAMFAAVLLWRTGNLWLAVGAHAGWDWGESFFYGVSDSGMQAQGHLLNPSVQGPAWLSGGSVGPEGSMLALVALIAMSVAAWLLLHKRSKEPALVITSGHPLKPL